MNNDRRKRIASVSERVSAIASVLDDLRSEIEEIRDEEQEYYDNMPESLQGGEKGDVAQAAVDALDTAASSLEEVDIDSIVNSLDEAAG